GCVDDLAQVSVNKLVRAVYRPRMMEQLLLEEPYALLCALVSPTILMAMYNSGSFEKAIHYLGTKNMNLSSLINLYASLARKVSGSKCVISQYQILESNASSALSLIEQVPDASDGRARAYMLLETMATQMTADLELVNQGYATFRNETKRYLEKTYARALQDSWDALSLREKFLSTRDCRKWFVHIGEQVVPQESPDLTTASVVCWNTPFGIVKRMGSAAFSYTCEKISTMTLRARTSTTRLALGTARFFAPDLMNCLTFSLILTTLLSIIGGVRAILQSFHSLQQMKANIKAGENQKRINKLYREFVKGKEDLPHTEEFISYVAEICPDLNEPLLELIYGKNFVRLQ
nr:P3 [Hyacinth mosaic virus]